MKMHTGIALVAMMVATTMTPAFAQAGADTYKASARCATVRMARGIRRW